MNRLKEHGIETPLWTLNGIETYARVVDIYDGDTIQIVIPVYDSYFRFHARLLGIDSCEMKSSLNKCLAIKSRNRLLQLCGVECQLEDSLTRKQIQTLLQHKVSIIFAKCFGNDKYGRQLVSISLDKDTESFADILYNEKLVYHYTGGKKLSEDEQYTLLNTANI
jgi:endonuclease YncB( thermonuclease family)